MGVNVVEYVVGVQCFVMVFGVGDIGSGIQIIVIFFLNNDVYWIVFFVFKFIKENYCCVFVFNCQVFGFQIGDNVWQYWIIQIFVYYIVMCQSDVQVIIGDLVLCYCDINQFMLYFMEIGIIVL